MQRVNVAADEDALAGLRTFIYSRQTVAADFLNELVGLSLFHPFVQDSVGQGLLSRQFGMRMEDMSQFNEVLHNDSFRQKYGFFSDGWSVIPKNCFIFAPKFARTNVNHTLSPKIQPHLQRQNLGRAQNQGSAWHGLWPVAELRRGVAAFGHLG